MDESYPPLWSGRFRHIFLLALARNWSRALCALYWFVTRRRIRGWGRLVLAASSAGQGYSTWISGSEARHFDAFRTANPERAAFHATVVVLGETLADHDAVARSIESAQSAFGEDVSVLSSVGEIANAGRLEWVFPLLAGDLFSPAAGEMIGRALAARPDALMISWDEDAIEQGQRCDPWIKPNWNGTLFERTGGLTGATCISAKALGSPEMLMSLFTSLSEWERTQLEVGNAFSGRVVHIPLLLTHRSAITRLPLSFRAAQSSQSMEAGQLDLPSVSIIVPTRDRPDLIGPCLRGIAATDYGGSTELIVVDNGTVDEAALAILEDHRARGVRVLSR